MTASVSSLRLHERAELLQQRGVFLGGPLRKFETVGRNQLSILLRNGLNMDSNVLDVGCGCLRAGYWLINFLDAGHYFGIEPNAEMLQAGKDVIVGESTIQTKQPRFDNNSDFDFDVFEEQMDFIIARSIWTHASPAQIEKMLNEFVAVTPPTGTFLVSIKQPRWYQRQYSGDSWVGKSDTSRISGIVRYRFSWIANLCRQRGLTAEKLQTEYGQTWIRIRKLSA